MKKSYWEMLKENIDSPSEIIPVLVLGVATWLAYLKILGGTEWLAAMGLCLAAHSANHALDPKEKV